MAWPTDSWICRATWSLEDEVGGALRAGGRHQEGLGLLGHPLGPLLGLLGLLLGFLHEGVPGLAHHLMFLGGLRYGETYSSPNAYGQATHGQRVLLQHPLEAAAGPSGLLLSPATQLANSILGLAGNLPCSILGLASDLSDPALDQLRSLAC